MTFEGPSSTNILIFFGLFILLRYLGTDKKPVAISFLTFWNLFKIIIPGWSLFYKNLKIASTPNVTLTTLWDGLLLYTGERNKVQDCGDSAQITKLLIEQFQMQACPTHNWGHFPLCTRCHRNFIHRHNFVTCPLTWSSEQPCNETRQVIFFWPHFTNEKTETHREFKPLALGSFRVTEKSQTQASWLHVQWLSL